MRTFKLLIADPSVDFCRKLADALGDGPELRVCHDGQKARELLEQFRPDVLILDLILPGLDGISLLRCAKKMDRPPICLVATGMINDYVQARLRSCEVDYLMLKPCNMSALAGCVYELIGSCEAAVFMPSRRENPLQALLLSLGMGAGSRRFRCVEAAMQRFLEDPCQSVTKELYPTVARELGLSAQAVEKAVRTEITQAWSRGDEGVWRMYFGCDRSGMVPRPTNSQFFGQIAVSLEMEMSTAQR